MSMQFHPFSEIFPLLPDPELAELAEDIKAFGLREAIWLYDGKILDGRNRWLACLRAKKDPQYRTFKGTEQGALALVISANLKRRQLTFEQRALAAARIAELGPGRPEKTGTGAGLTQEQAAETFDVSERSVRSARKIINQGSKPLQRAVEAGEIPIGKAAAVADLPKREQLTAAKAPSPKAETPADLGEFLTPEECARHEADEKRYLESLERAAGDSAKEIKRLNDLLTAAYQARDRYMNECAAKEKRIRALERELKHLKGRDKPKANGNRAEART